MRVLVWLSWWVDSAVSAYLLKEAWHDVSAGFMINYLDEENPKCPTKEDLSVAKEVAGFLDIPFYTFDYREEYEKRIIDYIYREYALGRTPNPDVFCNNLIKFELFLQEALEWGFDRIATGHYAQIFDYDGTATLFKWIDREKDQSYFLSRLSQSQLEKSIFPIGGMRKTEVRTLAENINLPNAKRRDSQGLCFIWKVSMREFLRRRLPKNPWNILDTRWHVIGRHEWAYAYTIGQRKGVGVGGGPARFVTEKNVHTNTITVSEREEDLCTYSLIGREWVWDLFTDEKCFTAKVRYRQESQDCIAQLVDEQTVLIRFSSPQRAITPWQIVVIYTGEMVVGSAIIDTTS